MAELRSASVDLGWVGLAMNEADQGHFLRLLAHLFTSCVLSVHPHPVNSEILTPANWSAPINLVHGTPHSTCRLVFSNRILNYDLQNALDCTV